jgi:hypothetical protein
MDFTLASPKTSASFAPFMRFLPFLLLAVIVVFSNACEKQPLEGDPDPRAAEKETSVSYESPIATKRERPAKRAQGAKPDDAPKFFPDKK